MGASTFSKRDLFMIHLNQIKDDYKTMSDNYIYVFKSYKKYKKENEELRAKLKEISEQLQNTDDSIDTCSLVDNEHGPDMHCSVCHGKIDNVFRYLMIPSGYGYKRCPHCGRLIENVYTGE